MGENVFMHAKKNGVSDDIRIKRRSMKVSQATSDRQIIKQEPNNYRYRL